MLIICHSQQRMRLSLTFVNHALFIARVVLSVFAIHSNNILAYCILSYSRSSRTVVTETVQLHIIVEYIFLLNWTTLVCLTHTLKQFIFVCYFFHILLLLFHFCMYWNRNIYTKNRRQKIRREKQTQTQNCPLNHFIKINWQNKKKSLLNTN